LANFAIEGFYSKRPQDKTMTELSDELLVAYVDGQLVLEQTRAVDKVLERDDVTARRVDALKDAHDRLESAFEAILAGEVVEILATPVLPSRLKPQRENGLAKIGLAIVGIGAALAALVGGYGWPLTMPNLAALPAQGPEITGAIPATKGKSPAP
jgi:anti-sigma factor RsiW